MKKLCTFLVALALVMLCIALLPTEAQAASESDLIFELNEDGESYYVADCKRFAVGSLTIPSVYNGKPVTSIGNYAFSDCDSLTSINIPDSVDSVGKYAFKNCTNLTSVTIPDSVTSIGEVAFYYCSSLTSVTIPDCVTSIADSAFAFCGSLTSINIPDSVVSIDHNAFFRCSSLTGIWVDTDNTVYSSDDRGVLFNKNKTELIEAPEALSGSYVVPDSVTSIGDDAFCFCSSLTSITIPDSVTSIGHYAFYCCYNLKFVTIGDSVTSIGRGAFCYCSSLTSITIPDSVTSIGNEAFSYCDKLTSIDIPNSVTSIGDYTFDECNNLTEVIYCGTQEQWNQIAIQTYNDPLLAAARKYHNWIPATCTTLAECTICGETGEQYGHKVVNDICTVCKKYGTCGETLTWTLDNNGTLTISGSGAMKNFTLEFPNGMGVPTSPWVNITKLIKQVVIEDGVTSIGDYAFYQCNSLMNVNIGKSVNSIGKDAFWDCDGITDIYLPDGLTSIGDSAFGETDGLTNISLPDGLISIGDSAFSSSNITSIVIPNSVTSIGAWAFSYCYDLKSIVLPEKLESIQELTFYCCIDLEQITIPSSITSICGSAFEECRSLTKVNLTDIAAWCSISFINDKYGIGIFNYIETLYLNGEPVDHLVIPEGVTSINSWAFYNLVSISGVTLPNTLTAIGADAFANCIGLTQIIIPENVTEIGVGAFYNCSNLTKVDITGHTDTISSGTFSGCTKLYAITIMGSVTRIDRYAFYGCNKLAYITYCGTQDQWKAIVIGEENTNLTNAFISYHNWNSNICTEPPICSVCGATEGEPLGHSWSDDADSICNGCGETRVVIPIVDASLNVQKHTMQITSDLKLGFSINIADVQNASDYYVVFKKIDGITAQNTRVTVTKEEIEANGTSGTRYYAYYPKVLAGEMNDKIQATLYVVDADGIVRCSQVDSYSVVDYLVLLMSTYENYPSYVNYMTVAVELLNYGTEAQKNFGYKVDTPANAVVFANGWQGYALEKDPVPQNNRNWGATNNSQKVIFKGSGLKLEESIYSNIRVDVSKLTAEEFANLKMVVKAGDGTIVQTIESKDFSAHTAANNYYITITKILPKDMSRIYTLEMYVGDTQVSSTATYSVESYVRLLQDSGLSAGAVALAALRYGTAAALLG